MQLKRTAFSGTTPIFTGSPSIVQGGFNLDREKQNFDVGDDIPAGTLAICNEETRLVQVLKTAKVSYIDLDDAKIITLEMTDYRQPIFAVGDRIMKAIGGNFSDAPVITKIQGGDEEYIIMLDKEITGLAIGDVLEEVVDNEGQAASIGSCNCVTVSQVTVKEEETSIDVSKDTMQYELYERRISPIPSSQKDATGQFLAANSHVKFTKSM